MAQELTEQCCVDIQFVKGSIPFIISKYGTNEILEINPYYANVPRQECDKMIKVIFDDYSRNTQSNITKPLPLNKLILSNVVVKNITNKFINTDNLYKFQLFWESIPNNLIKTSELIIKTDTFKTYNNGNSWMVQGYIKNMYSVQNLPTEFDTINQPIHECSYFCEVEFNGPINLNDNSLPLNKNVNHKFQLFKQLDCKLQYDGYNHLNNRIIFGWNETFKKQIEEYIENDPHLAFKIIERKLGLNKIGIISFKVKDDENKENGQETNDENKENGQENDENKENDWIQIPFDHIGKHFTPHFGNHHSRDFRNDGSTYKYVYHIKRNSAITPKQLGSDNERYYCHVVLKKQLFITEYGRTKFMKYLRNLNLHQVLAIPTFVELYSHAKITVRKLKKKKIKMRFFVCFCLFL